MSIQTFESIIINACISESSRANRFKPFSEKWAVSIRKTTLDSDELDAEGCASHVFSCNDQHEECGRQKGKNYIVQWTVLTIVRQLRQFRCYPIESDRYAQGIYE